ncbi:DUF2157 domain-containing protein [Filobacillus milosensis]|uniref:DUF2157 domain-containing protein n=1 Tax=Filobacillus milosensis TaxID=94137 RepID=A0A4Y8IT02_9BACI|nr:DUF2157 domain-containing protein [Filobacillus milosensis]TFB22052.1 DUF2157 domain-containing protein [Filobacillus milosensis]
MKKTWLKEESEKWVNDGIINSEQREQIMGRYQDKNQVSLIFFFSAVLVGLACLSFVAANWQAIPETIRMALIIVFMISFYALGSWFENKKQSPYSVFCYVIALAIFGSGIFLTGQMYHYSLNNVFPFIVWGLAALLIYLSRPHLFLWFVGVIIVTVGQIYGLSNMHNFDWWLFSLFMVGYGSVIFIKPKMSASWLFAIAFCIQILGYSLDQLGEYYWLFIFTLVLYTIGGAVSDVNVSRPFQWVALIFMFILTIVEALMFESSYSRPDVGPDLIFYLVWAILFGLAVVLTLRKDYRIILLQLVLFLPIFVWPDWTSMLAYIVLYLFSIGKLLEGYHQYDQRKIHVGTGAFLISTFIVYMQVAWDFLDKSLFFLIGGIILFVIGFILERHRKGYVSQKREDV